MAHFNSVNENEIFFVSVYYKKISVSIYLKKYYLGLCFEGYRSLGTITEKMYIIQHKISTRILWFWFILFIYFLLYYFTYYTLKYRRKYSSLK